MHDEVADKKFEGAELRALSDDLRRLEDLRDRIFPMWTRMNPSELIDSFDGTSVPQHWAHANGQDQYFHTAAELQNFIELQKAGRESIDVFTGPDCDVDRDRADVLTCRLAQTEQLQALLLAIEEKGVKFRGGGKWRVETSKEDRTPESCFSWPPTSTKRPRPASTFSATRAWAK